MPKTIGKYEVHHTIGEGSFGKVKYAINTEDQEPVAIKILDKAVMAKENMSIPIKREISLMRKINHKHVIGVKDVFATSSKIFIVLEYVPGGELFLKINQEGKLSEHVARKYMNQLIDGIDCCHRAGICHRDLKPENLLLDANGDLKIGDFGLATLYVGDAESQGMERQELLHTTCGTPNYVAPEVLSTEGYDGHKADIWSMGVLLYVLTVGYLPFEEGTTAALFQKIKTASYKTPEHLSPGVKDLLRRILVPDPQKRSSMAEMQAHPWILDIPFDDSVFRMMDQLSAGGGKATTGSGSFSSAVSDDFLASSEALHGASKGSITVEVVDDMEGLHEPNYTAIDDGKDRGASSLPAQSPSGPTPTPSPTTTPEGSSSSSAPAAAAPAPTPALSSSPSPAPSPAPKAKAAPKKVRSEPDSEPEAAQDPITALWTQTTKLFF